MTLNEALIIISFSTKNICRSASSNQSNQSKSMGHGAEYLQFAVPMRHLPHETLACALPLRFEISQYATAAVATDGGHYFGLVGPGR